MLCDGPEGQDGFKGGPKGGNTCTHVADSLHCTAEANTALQSNYTPVREGTEKAMAPHSSTLAWKIPWVEEPGRLQSMGS